MKFIRSIVGLMAFVAVGPTGMVSADSHGGPCSGESSAQFGLAAHHVGGRARNAPKVIVHASTDDRGNITGKLVFERGAERMSIVAWCRLWGGGESGESHEGVVHLLGVRPTFTGTEQFVRVDLKLSEGGGIRVMTRPVDHEGHGAAAESDHGWKSLTGEGWLAVNRVRVGAIMER